MSLDQYEQVNSTMFNFDEKITSKHATDINLLRSTLSKFIMSVFILIEPILSYSQEKSIDKTDQTASINKKELLTQSTIPKAESDVLFYEASSKLLYQSNSENVGWYLDMGQKPSFKILADLIKIEEKRIKNLEVIIKDLTNSPSLIERAQHVKEDSEFYLSNYKSWRQQSE